MLQMNEAPVEMPTEIARSGQTEHTRFDIARPGLTHPLP